MKSRQGEEKLSSSGSSTGALHSVSRFTDHDVYLFKEGNHFRLYEKFGAHVMDAGGVKGTYFAVWAPNAEDVSVVGDFNGWNPAVHRLKVRGDESGIWEGFVPEVGHGAAYKYHLKSRYNRFSVSKGDPFALYWEVPPRTASIVWDYGHEWSDGKWMSRRAEVNSLNAPSSVYEAHLGSWMRVPDDHNRSLTYGELAERLVDYVAEMGFTHVEFLPVMEHPFYGSWGYQVTGYFAPTSRYGNPDDFAALIEAFHARGIGVIMDWVPSHFPSDEHGLVYFDGTHLYEHADSRKGFHPDWKSYIFNYGRNEVRAFLISSACFWLDRYHIDGLRVDAVASMLYLDYGRKDGEWIPNPYGGRENIEAITLIRRLNEAIYSGFPSAMTIAEESTAWPMVSRPTYIGGLGFGMKWMMGWMHDTLDYFSNDPVYRKYHHNALTFSIWYAFTENFVLPLSHDEVVYGKGSLLRKMPGDDWRRFANLRILFGYMFGHPGKKLLFMGGEFGQWSEWNHDQSLEWHLLEFHPHQGVQRWVRDLNHLYTSEPALHELDFNQDGFQWVDSQDWEQSIISFIRKGRTAGELILVVANCTPVLRHHYRVGVPIRGVWREVLNSDAEIYGGSGQGNLGACETIPIPSHGFYDSLSLTIPPLGILFFKSEGHSR